MSENGTALTSQNSLPSSPLSLRQRAPRRIGALFAASFALAAGCGGKDTTDVVMELPALTPSETPAVATPDPVTPEPATPDPVTPDEPVTPVGDAGPLYAVMYEVYDDVGSTSYLSLIDSLEIDAIDVTKAREYGGGGGLG